MRGAAGRLGKPRARPHRQPEPPRVTAAAPCPPPGCAPGGFSLCKHQGEEPGSAAPPRPADPRGTPPDPTRLRRASPGPGRPRAPRSPGRAPRRSAAPARRSGEHRAPPAPPGPSGPPGPSLSAPSSAQGSLERPRAPDPRSGAAAQPGGEGGHCPSPRGRLGSHSALHGDWKGDNCCSTASFPLLTAPGRFVCLHPLPTELGGWGGHHTAPRGPRCCHGAVSWVRLSSPAACGAPQVFISQNLVCAKCGKRRAAHGWGERQR